MRFTDTGPGVPTELRERIFEPFVSFGKQEGAGLELAIAERIVSEHGGGIQVESPEGGALYHPKGRPEPR
jgi:nitrogen-specific signal transduction histidine kinase